MFQHSTGTWNLNTHKTTFPLAILNAYVFACVCVCLTVFVENFYCKMSRTMPSHQSHMADDCLSSTFEHVNMLSKSLFCICALHGFTKSVDTNTCCHSTPVSSALGDVDQLLDATCVGQGLGVLHVFARDLVQGATDGRHSLIRQQGGVPPRETIDQVPHRILPWEGEG